MEWSFDKQNITVTSEASDHSRIAALSYWLRVLSEELPLYHGLIVYYHQVEKYSFLTNTQLGF